MAEVVDRRMEYWRRIERVNLLKAYVDHKGGTPLLNYLLASVFPLC